MSLRDKYKEAGGLRRETITVPEWGEVMVRELTAPEYEAYQLSQLDFTKLDPEGKPARDVKLGFARLACWAVIDPETGARVFDEADLEWLGGKPSRVLAPIGAKVLELTGVGGAEKNSETTPTSSPSTT